MRSKATGSIDFEIASEARRSVYGRDVVSGILTGVVWII